jgi:BirA family biotin operon repressor/biotin-[acetyl-CoA-carboxylase] ligase
MGVTDCGLKWPNDLLWRGQKLGGILVETRRCRRDDFAAVIGIGINCAFAPKPQAAIDQPWTDLATALGYIPSRNLLAARLLAELVSLLSHYARSGFTDFVDEWREYDVMRGRRVTLITPTGNVSGKALGIDQDGALMVSTNGMTQRHWAGEISLRIAE